VQVVSITATTALVVAVMSNGAVEKHTVELAEPIGEERIGAATVHLAAHLTGRGRQALGALPATGDAATDALCTLALGSLRRHGGDEPDQVFVGGTSQVAHAFDAIETVREVLGILEQQYVVVTLLRDVLDRGMHVAIGTETGMAPLAECAVIVAPYRVDGEAAGTIGVLGPARMDYPQAMAAVAVVSHRLSQRLTEG
jgi:heat-inducible transcriptional repressor